MERNLERLDPEKLFEHADGRQWWFEWFSCMCCVGAWCRSELVTAPSRSTDVLALPDARAGERVPVQPLPHAQATHRDRARALPHRATDQDLVPEPPHEGQEGEDADHGAQRAREVVVVMATTASAAAASRCISAGDAWHATARLVHCCRSLTALLFVYFYILALNLHVRPLHDKLEKTCSRIDVQTHVGSALDSCATLTFDFLISGSVHIYTEGLPITTTLVSMAEAVFFLESGHRQTDGQIKSWTSQLIIQSTLWLYRAGMSMKDSKNAWHQSFVDAYTISAAADIRAYIYLFHCVSIQ